MKIILNKYKYKCHATYIFKNFVFQALHIYLRFTSDIASVLKAIVSYGLEHSNLEIVHETLISIPLLFPEDFDERYCGGPQRNLFYLVSGLAKKLQPEDTRLPAFMSLQRLADVVGVKQFQVSFVRRFHVKYYSSIRQFVFDSSCSGVVFSVYECAL